MRWCRERRRILTPARCGRGLRPAPAWLGGAKGGVELIPVRVAEDERVDVSHWTQVGVPGGPGSVDVGRGDPADVPQDLGLDGGDAECPGQHLSQADVVRALGVGPDEPRIADLPRCDQTACSARWISRLTNGAGSPPGSRSRSG